MNIFNSNVYAIHKTEIDNKTKILQQYNENQENAHKMAEAARALGYAEDSDVIMNAKEIWAKNQVDKDYIENELKSLKEAQKKYEMTQTKKEYIGDFKLTGYCPCYSCSEGWGTQTASGNRANAGVTVAADTRILPLGTRIYIEGVGERIVQDVGGGVRGNHIDVFVNNHAECYNSNINGYARVYIIH